MTDKTIKEERINRLNQIQEERKQQALEKVNQALERMKKSGAKINFQTVAKEANVSVSYLYKYPEIKTRIAEIRNQQSVMPRPRMAEPSSNKSHQKIVSRLQTRIKQLEAELTETKKLNESKIFDLTTDKKDKFTTEPINDCLADIFNELEQGSLPLYPTGLTDLDSLIGGLTKQDLIIVAARPSMGKSWFACYLANYIATNEKKPVVFFSAEMSRKQLAKRFLAMHTGIDSQRLMNNVIYQDEYDSLVNGLSNLAELTIEINDTPAEQLTPTKIRSELRKIQSKRGELGLVVLDYIQKLGDRAAGNRAQVIGKYSGACKDIGKMFNVPFVVLAQINRGVETQNNKRPTMASIKDSGDVEQDSDLLLMLYRDEYYKSDTEDNGVMEVIIGKNRNGATGTCKILFDPSIGKFTDLI